MRLLLEQLEQSLCSQSYYMSLFTALSLPDIAGALCSEDGFASGAKYKAWYEAWVRPRFMETVLESVPEHAREFISDMENPLDGESCYLFRCSLLHQGRMEHPKSQFSRIIFIEPGATSNVVHYGIMNDALCIDLDSFCKEVIRGVRLWLDTAESTELYQKNYSKFVKRHPTGLSPFIGGVAVIG